MFFKDGGNPFDVDWTKSPPHHPIDRAIYDIVNKAIEERLRPPPYFVGTGEQFNEAEKLVSRSLLSYHLNNLQSRLDALERSRQPWWKRWFRR